MYTPLIAFAPSTLEPLFQGVTVHPSSNDNLTSPEEKVRLTAKDIFGDWYYDLNTRREDMGTLKSFLGTTTLLSAGTIIVPITGALLFPAASYFILPHALTMMKTASCVFGLGTVILTFTPENTWHSKNDTLALACDRITDFVNRFEDFKNNPEEDTVKDLFSTFDKISELTDPPYNIHFEGHDISLLSATGKLFLMDAIIKLLPNNTDLLNEWTSTLKSTKDSGFSEPWRRFKIENPDMDAYIDYFKQCGDFESINLDNQMIQAFKTLNMA